MAPPRGGKTVLLKTIARSIRANYPQVELIVLLLDERPEEVTDFEETVDARFMPPPLTNLPAAMPRSPTSSSNAPSAWWKWAGTS